MYCPTCGARNSPDSIACHACGAILPGVLGAGAPSVPPAPAPAQAPPTSGFSALGDAPVVTVAPARGLSETPPDPEHAVHASAGPAPEAWKRPSAPPAQVAWSAPAAPAPASAPAAPAPAAGDGRLLGSVKLVVEQGKILGEQFLLGDFDISIGRYDAGTGRCPDIDLTAQDPAYVHRQHARLTFSPDGRHITLHDLGGRNGSYVNNQLLDKNGSAPVKLGDKVRIGRVVMRLQPAVELDKDPPRR